MTGEGKPASQGNCRRGRNEAPMSFLRAHQCDEIQGYYFSRPLAVDKVADKLRQVSAQNA